MWPFGMVCMPCVSVAVPDGWALQPARRMANVAVVNRVLFMVVWEMEMKAKPSQA
jgi:hypothetical protein